MYYFKLKVFSNTVKSIYFSIRPDGIHKIRSGRWQDVLIRPTRRPLGGWRHSEQQGPRVSRSQIR